MYIADQIRTRWRHVACRRKQTQKQESGFHPLPLRQSYSTPEGLVKLKESQFPLHKLAQDEQSFVHQSNESFSGFSSLEVSPNRSHRLRSYSLSVKDPYSQVLCVFNYSYPELLHHFCVLNSLRELLGAYGTVR